MRRTCWCGNTELQSFSPRYFRCSLCNTLVVKTLPAKAIGRVLDDDGDFYGKNYFTEYLPQRYGIPHLNTRVRAEIPERCTHWLRTLLHYKVPPATVLELGASHGGFVALMRWAGYEATGLELSPWLVEFARTTFNVPMLQGPLEDQNLKDDALDAIILMDVLEHVPDPVDTLRRCIGLLKDDGILVVQIPQYPENETYERLVARAHPFLAQMNVEAHLHLFSCQAIRQLLLQLGIHAIQFEEAIFSHYDMFFVAGRAALVPQNHDQIERALAAVPTGRLVQALLDAYERIDVIEKDRAAAHQLLRKQQDILQSQNSLLTSFPVRAWCRVLRVLSRDS